MFILERTTQIKEGRKKFSPRCIRRMQHCSIGAALKLFGGWQFNRPPVANTAQRKFAKLHAKRTRVVVPKLGFVWRRISEVTRPERPHTESHCEFSSRKRFFGKSVYCAISSPRTASIEPAGLSRATRHKRHQSSLSRNCDSVSSVEVEVFLLCFLEEVL